MQGFGILLFSGSLVPGRGAPEPPKLMLTGLLFLIVGIAAAELILIIVLLPLFEGFDVTGINVLLNSFGSLFTGLLGRA